MKSYLTWDELVKYMGEKKYCLARDLALEVSDPSRMHKELAGWCKSRQLIKYKKGWGQSDLAAYVLPDGKENFCRDYPGWIKR